MTSARKDINLKIIPEFKQGLSKDSKILFVGVHPKIDYSEMFDGEFITLDINPKLNPDIVADIQYCPEIKTDTYDGVVLIGVWEYVQNRMGMLNEIRRILKDGGKLLACFPSDLYYPDHHKYFDMRWHFQMLKGFYIEKIYVSYYKTKQPYYYHFFLHK